MHEDHPLLIISGSNRADSNTLKVARVLMRHYQSLGVAAELYGMEQLPSELFLPDAYTKKPAKFVEVQQRVVRSAGLHVVTPEYNGSFPGVLKHFIDMLKFPESFEGKPVAFVGVAAGDWGGLRAVEQLQLVFGYRHAHVFPQRVFLSSIGSALTPAGELADRALDQRLARQTREFARFASTLQDAQEQGP